MLNKPYTIPETTPMNEVAECLPPCRMSLDELKTELRLSVEDAQKGLFFTIEQARKRHPRV